MISTFLKIRDCEPNKEVSIEEIENLIKNNPNKEKIKRLHEMDINSTEYKLIKADLPCVTPHATFFEWKTTENVKRFSNFLYYDIDVYNTTCSIDEYQNRVINTIGDKATFIGRSVSNKGLFVYIKVSPDDCITQSNFPIVYNHVRENVLKDLDIDLNAGGITRFHIIPHDPNVYCNHSSSISLPENLIVENDFYELNSYSTNNSR